MRVFRAPLPQRAQDALRKVRAECVRSVRRAPAALRLPRVPRAVRITLICLPGLAAVAGLVLWAVVGGAGTPSGVPRAVATRDVPEHRAARPAIVPRDRWLGDGGYQRPPARYADHVHAVFVHHTNSPNDYDCADTPRIIRSLYVGQAGARRWDDIGYNFVVDRCGQVYEGRAGGSERPVVGAHTQGFNVGSTGIAALGTFTAGVPVPQAMTDAIAAVAAWKLGLSDIDPRAPVRMVSTNSMSKYAAGTTATFLAVSGHADGFHTACPGAALTARLPAIRERAARLQGRP
ncbi:peptidoglycan recognition protein family protein [Streptomyces sporangiiformans]|uniref:N-acetylmuramoyl-L-alanine amidase n=1 Tax=Streptomyces sporangiiformans TaxID=2315329 RepID=A0A505D0W7_9ACTN|nr:peptidoglycan recognition protein [Streptomyces sporangiiformans]TPQ17344.1 N-acetylmuramoyl-L-alanine amidase [Streptomyces sporangiiformans]